MDVIYTGLYLNHEICFCLLFVFEDKMNAFTPYFVIYIYNLLLHLSSSNRSKML